MSKQTQTCEPIKSAIQLLESKGFEIVSSTLRDFHFNEYEIKLESKNAVQSVALQIEGIEKKDEQTYNCKCHWSTICLNKTDIEPTKIINVLPIDYYELIIETETSKKYLFNPSELNLYEKHKFLAYPDNLRSFKIIENSIIWEEGYEIHLSEIREICKLLSHEEAKNKMITIASKNNAPTEKHKTHHVYSIHLKPYNSDQLICLSESIHGGLGDTGGGHYYSLDNLVKTDNWTEHMNKSNCAWGISIIESANTEKEIVDKLVKKHLELNKR